MNTIFFAPMRLAPPPEKRRQPLLKMLWELTWLQWALFGVGWLAWTCDALDFFSVSVSVPALSKQFNKPTSTITQAITLTLLFRSIGAVLFGIFSDRFGRKWPLVFNLLLVAVLELGAGFVQTFRQFLALRSLFGIGMGGIWGLAASTSLENLPVELRGFASGILQEGYAFGNLLAALISLKLVQEVAPGWRALFWTASGISVFGAFLRSLLPESEAFLKARRAAEAHGTVSEAQKTRVFIRETNAMLKKHWMLCIYAVLLLTDFNFLAHGSQDLYPTYVQENKGFSTHASVVATIIGNCGAIAGGAVAGWASQFLGRRITIVLCEILTGAFIPLWILPNGFAALAAGAFCIQFGVQGAWGVIPIHLTEMAPPAFRATFPGVAYQIGNMIASAAAQIEATSGDHLKTFVNGKVIPDYGKVQGILIGAVAAFVILITIIGPAENHSSHFENHRVAFDERGAGDNAFIDDAKGVLSNSGRPDREKASEERVSAEKPQIAAA
ncbi:MFS general substrate transporter [Mycena albidolilacea]|uniref:MFS general substrate transporter n=1 Tax=Mycena albidolilacea TaxID=1033008 RepID=A0AAD6Z1M2_9AGAR|nr:MFS general substrate transporter [Mycena albidolilacea]